MKVLCILLASLLVGFCGTRSAGSKSIPLPEPQQAEKPVAESPKGAIVLFGVKISGNPDTFLSELDRLPFFELSADKEGSTFSDGKGFSRTVMIDGIPYGMNVYYESKDWTGEVSSIIFITGQTDGRIIKGLVKRLTEYYGKPDIADTGEDGYTWFVGKRFMKARRLHHDEGGWTFYIM